MSQARIAFNQENVSKTFVFASLMLRLLSIAADCEYDCGPNAVIELLALSIDLDDRRCDEHLRHLQ
jgi:hypothetical protein